MYLYALAISARDCSLTCFKPEYVALILPLVLKLVRQYLSVNYQEKYYAAGKIPGGYFKREARPTEAETLISRLIDRPIRPLFPSSFLNEVQLLPTVLSYDGDNQPDILSIIASSAALAISGLPFQGPIAASRVGYKDGKYLLNPSIEELKESEVFKMFKMISVAFFVGFGRYIVFCVCVS